MTFSLTGPEQVLDPAQTEFCFDNAAVESFFSTLDHEVLSRHHFATRAEARVVVGAWCYEFYNHRRRHTSAAGLPPARYEMMLTDAPSAA